MTLTPLSEKDMRAWLEENDEKIFDQEYWSGIALAGPIEPTLPTEAFNGILIVGKAPGTAEIAHGAPFTGPSGRLLDKMLDRAGIVRNATAFTNVFKMQPSWTTDGEGKKRQNDIGLFFTPDITAGNSRLPPLNELYVKEGPSDHVRDLWIFARKLKPKLVIGLGNIAAWGLLGDLAIGLSDGEPVYDTPLLQKHGNAPIFITRHPALAQHTGSEATALQIASDIQKAHQWLLDSQTSKEPEP